MTRQRAIVVGAGIAGLATARGLLGLGWDVTVYEQAQSFRPVGTGIILAPNAVRSLEWLGLGGEVRSGSRPHGDTSIRDASGRWLLRGRVRELEARFGVPSFALHRADLHDMLVAATSAAELRTGCEVIATADGRRPAIAFAATSEDSADLIVGADGLWSVVRTAVAGQHPGPAYAGYITWRGLVPAEMAPPSIHDTGITETWGRGRRFGVVPLGDRQVYWYATASFARGSHEADRLEDLRERYAGWHEPIPELLARTPPDSLLRHEIYHLATPLPRYARTRIVLVGDAAHAMTPDIGQGGGAALEDAVVLTHALTHAPDIPTALGRFDQLRRRRTQRMVRLAAVTSRVAQWKHPALVAIRNSVVRTLPPSLFLRLADETLGWRPPVADDQDPS
jgi:2-polyprenyl-6-methoxyphenol hydroxylase-like FAD-dependent oxidoreductase